MKKYLITGFSGFVSPHFLRFLDDNSIRSSVLGVDLRPPAFQFDKYENVKCDFRQLDLLDNKMLAQSLAEFRPDRILHLASFSSVAFSWKDPSACFANNTNIFLNLLEAVRGAGIDCRILSVGSSEEYGNVDPRDLPLREDRPPSPISPYAVARVSQELLSRVYAESLGLDIVMTRSFNHVGPGQKPNFVIASFAKQLVEQKRQGSGSGSLTTGDTSIVRDFLDVRDVVSAYFALLEKGRRGEIYNVCSGVGISLKDIIKQMADMLALEVTTKTDKGLIRPNDNKVIIGSNEKIRREVGWENVILLETSLRDILDHWSSQ